MEERKKVRDLTTIRKVLHHEIDSLIDGLEFMDGKPYKPNWEYSFRITNRAYGGEKITFVDK
jgi:hypothetical protein